MTILFEKNWDFGQYKVLSEKPDFPVIEAKQVHGITIQKKHECIEADGFEIASSDKSVFAIKTADCMPIILKAKDKVYFIHAGWRGLASGILKQDTKIEYAFIGPSISVKSFEVTSEFANHFPKTDNLIADNSKLFFDLQREAESQICNLYPNAQVENCGICTFIEQNFHSYRRDKTPHRNWNLFQWH